RREEGGIRYSPVTQSEPPAPVAAAGTGPSAPGVASAASKEPGSAGAAASGASVTGVASATTAASDIGVARVGSSVAEWASAVASSIVGTAVADESGFGPASVPSWAGACSGTGRPRSARTNLPGPTRIQVTGEESVTGSTAVRTALRARTRLRRGLAVPEPAG